MRRQPSLMRPPILIDEAPGLINDVGSIIYGLWQTLSSKTLAIEEYLARPC